MLLLVASVRLLFSTAIDNRAARQNVLRGLGNGIPGRHRAAAFYFSLFQIVNRSQYSRDAARAAARTEEDLIPDYINCFQNASGDPSTRKSGFGCRWRAGCVVPFTGNAGWLAGNAAPERKGLLTLNQGYRRQDYKTTEVQRETSPERSLAMEISES